MADHAVLVHITSLGDEDAGLDEIEDPIIEAINAAAVGEFDGNEIGPDGAVLYMYGPDADRLWGAVEPVLRSAALGPGSHAVKRYGDPGAREKRIELTPSPQRSAQTVGHPVRASARRKRTWELGDVFTVPCGDEVALAQYVATGRSWRTEGDWLRVSPNLMAEVPADPCAVVAAEGGWLERGFIGNWVGAGDIVWLTHCPPPPEGDGDIPSKGSPGFLDNGGVLVPILPWVVFDGETEWWYESLPPEYDALPSFALRDGRSLSTRLSGGWAPEDDVARFGRTVVLAADEWLHLADSYGLVLVEGESGSISARRPSRGT